jgi:hypothetical protein
MSVDKEVPGAEVPMEEAKVDHAERGREIAGAAAERMGAATEKVKGMFGRMREKMSGFVNKVKERSSALGEKGANLLFGGIGAGEYFAKKSAEKVGEVGAATVAKYEEVKAAGQAKKAEFGAKRDATVESWKDSVSMVKIKAEMRRIDKRTPYETHGAVDASEMRAADQIQNQMEAQMKQMQADHDGMREQINQKATLKSRMDAILAKRGAGAGAGSQQTEQAAA